MLRISVLAPMIFGFTTVADARQLTCDEFDGRARCDSQSPKTVKLGASGERIRFSLISARGVMSVALEVIQNQLKFGDKRLRGGVFSLHRPICSSFTNPATMPTVQSRVKAGSRTVMTARLARISTRTGLTSGEWDVGLRFVGSPPSLCDHCRRPLIEDGDLLNSAGRPRRLESFVPC